MGISPDYTAIEFVAKYDNCKSIAARRSMLHAILNRLDSRQLQDAISDSKVVVPLTGPRNRATSLLGPRPYTGVSVFIFVDGKILLHKRISKINHGNGDWSLAGGHQEFGESPEAAAVREVHEETGIELAESELEPLGVFSTYFKETHRHYNTIFFVSQPAKTQYGGVFSNRIPHAASEWGLFPLNKLPKPVWEPVKAVMRNHGRSLSAKARRSIGTVVTGLNTPIVIPVAETVHLID